MAQPKQEQADASKRPDELDGAGRPIYRAMQTPKAKPNEITVELATLEDLADRYDVPHFVIRDFETVDPLGIKIPEKGWNYHFIFLPHAGMVVGYEKTASSEEGSKGGE